MKPVTDPALLAQLNGGGNPVTDPALLAQLNAPDESGAEAARLGRQSTWTDQQQMGQNFRDVTQGAKSAFDRAALGVKGLLPQSVQDAGDWIDRQMGSGGLTKETAVQQPDSGYGMAGAIGADIAMGAAPVARGAQVLTRTLGGLGRAAPLVADVAANAGYAAATAPEDRGTAAAFGGGGAAVGRGLGRVATGIVRPTDEAAALIQQGVRLTPGQAAGRDSLINNLEQKATSLPVAGYAIQSARNRALEDANMAVAKAVADHVDEALKLRHPPTQAIEEVRDVISGAYDEVLPRLSLSTSTARETVNGSLNQLADENALVGIKQFKSLANYMETRLKGIQGDTVSGELLKQIDSELGSKARMLARSTSAEEKVAAPMWYEMQRDWRELMKAAAKDPDDIVQLSKANAGYRELLAIEKALRSSGGETIKPRQLARALENAGIKSGPLADTSTAMSKTIQGTVSDTGTVGRLLANALPLALAGGGAYAGSDPALYGGLGAAALLGTRTGARLITGQGAAQRKMVELLRSRGATRAQAEEAVKQIGSQVGRAAATQ